MVRKVAETLHESWSHPLRCAQGMAAQHGARLQEPVLDDLCVSTLLEGCRSLRKLALVQVQVSDRAMFVAASRSAQLQVGCMAAASMSRRARLAGTAQAVAAFTCVCEKIQAAC